MRSKYRSVFSFCTGEGCGDVVCGDAVWDRGGIGMGWRWGFEAGRGILAVKGKIAARSKRNGKELRWRQLQELSKNVNTQQRKI